MEAYEKLQFIKMYDPDAAARLERLLGKKDNLKEGNAYGERFTERQFQLVVLPLLDILHQRARILEALNQGTNTIPVISERLGIDKDIVFDHLKELMRKTLVEIKGHRERHAIFSVSRPLRDY